MEINLTQGKVALVNDEDYEEINRYKWYAVKKPHSFYAVRMSPRIQGERDTVWMHRAILGIGGGLDVDHIDRDGLNNTRENLRVATRSQNRANLISKCGSSKYKGVYWRNRGNRWEAQIGFNGDRLFLGSFSDEADAALRYNEAAIQLFGEFARINAIEV